MSLLDLACWPWLSRLFPKPRPIASPRSRLKNYAVAWDNFEEVIRDTAKLELLNFTGKKFTSGDEQKLGSSPVPLETGYYFGESVIEKQQLEHAGSISVDR
jgi:hypothetical protein